ncbi:ANTAR domain-containing response regulator [Phycisphaerales bacterium AB-hyl4]|uniref:ANTAR domain-containing response regulator n=1 Tax=Natronomicrosphaera hydrolytica TaxID=3242702 RepID=A0ABV4U7K9_9BACT
MADPPVRVMVIDEHPDRAAALESALRSAGYTIVSSTGPGDFLPQRVRETKADVVLIDVDAPDRDTLEQVQAIHRDAPRPIVMFSANQDRRTIEQAIDAGVSAYIVERIDRAQVQPIIEVAIAQFRRFQALRDELEKARTSLTQRKLVDRAKGILMSQRNLTEPEAYRALQKLAMDRKRLLVDVARDVIDMAHLLSSEAEAKP